MEVRAVAKYVKVQPRKVRIIADEVRGKDALYAVSLLRYHRSKSAFHLHKVLISAIANAANNANLSPETLRIATIQVDEGPRQKRMQARAMGRGNRILKKTAHITVVVEDVDKEAVAKVKTTPAKARPTFGARPKKAVGAPTVNVPSAAAPAIVAPAAVAPTTAATAPVVEEATPVTADQQPEQEGSAVAAPADAPATTPTEENA